MHYVQKKQAGNHKMMPACFDAHKIGGERGIRTLDRVLTYTPLAGARLQPLGHLSKTGAIIAQVLKNGRTDIYIFKHYPECRLPRNLRVPFEFSDKFLPYEQQHL